MVDSTLRVTWKTQLGLALCWWLLAACRSPAVPVTSAAQAAVLAPELAPLLVGQTVQTHELTPPGRWPNLPPGATAVVYAPAGLPTGAWLTKPAAAELAAQVQSGLHLVLLGHAGSLAVELGADAVGPTRSEVRWGFDQRTQLGLCELGVLLTSGQQPEWFADLAPQSAAQEFAFPLLRSAPCKTQVCTWEAKPERGTLLGSLWVAHDGQPLQVQAPAMVHWRMGRGSVVALGLLPDLQSTDAACQRNAKQLLARVLARAGSAPLAVVRVAPKELRAVAALSLDLAARAPLRPGRFAHWGWQVPANEALLASSFAAGADLLQVALCDAAGVASLPWSSKDPLTPPAGWRSVSDSDSQREALRILTQAARVRGMQVTGDLGVLQDLQDPAAQLAVLRFFARELGDLRRDPDSALQGFLASAWWPDAHGLGTVLAQDFSPHACFLRGGELAAPTALGTGIDLWCQHADNGALPASSRAAPGLSAKWRMPSPAARAVLAAQVPPDWIATQARDFLAAQRCWAAEGDGGATAWWHAATPEALSPDQRAMVHGFGLEGLSTAMAMALTATGKGGERDAMAQALAAVPAGFGAETELPATLHVVRNNWLQLLGSGGALQWDGRGLGEFASAFSLSPSLVRTRLRGARPDSAAVSAADVDLLGTQRSAVVVSREPSVPGTATLLLPCAPKPGQHALQLTLRALAGQGLCTVCCDDVALGCAMLAVGEPTQALTFNLPVGRLGPRTVQVQVADGAAVVVERARLLRTGEVGSEARVGIAAGSLAELHEFSASHYHAESVRLRMLSDQPALVLTWHCEQAVRNLQFERALQLPLHRQLLAYHGSLDALAGPCVLASSEAEVPDLIVLPLAMRGTDRLLFRDGELALHSAGEPNSACSLGLFFAPHGLGMRWRSTAEQALHALHQPLELSLADGALATIADDATLAWTRVLQVPGAPALPYAVRERGLWTWRGVQQVGEQAFLRVVHTPGDEVQIRGGPSLWLATRPGPASLHRVGLRDMDALGARVQVLAESRIAPPAVTLGAKFDAVFVDGEPWAYHDGQTVYLPDRIGEYRVRARAHGGAAVPSVRATSAPLRACAYDAVARVLTLVTAYDPRRAPELPYVAVLRGAVPSRIENGEMVPVAELRLSAAAAAAATAGGVLIRFRSGTTRVHYGAGQ